MIKKLFAKRIYVPGWLFLMVTALYSELMLHIWTNDTLVPGRMAAVAVFALAFGCGYGSLCRLLPAKAEKWAAVVFGALLAVLTLLEYFLDDAYGVFMSLVSVFATAEGVATGYLSTVLQLLAKNWWRILVVLLPVVLYAIFGKTCVSDDRKKRWLMTAAVLLLTAILFGAGFGIVYGVNLDTIQLTTYNFDGAIRSFGLNMGMVMDLTQTAGGGGDAFQLDQPETTVPPTQSVEDTTPPETSVETQPVETEPPVVYEPHAFDLDFNALADAESSSKIADVHRYVASLTPDMENEYTGLFAGKNLILITAEAFSAQVIDPELTPTLYRLSTQGIQFTDFYHPLLGAGTTGGEFANLVGLIPGGGTTTMQEAVQQDLFFTMGKQLQRQGYSSSAFHNNDHTYYNRHKTHTHLGYDTFYAYGNGMEKEITKSWTQSDLEMIDVTLPKYIDQQPFSLYYMTVSGHSSYTSYNAMGRKNYHLVEDLPYSKPVKYYLACQLELEHALASMVKQLEDAGIADDTVIVLATDHYPYGLAPSDTWGNGKDYLAELYGVKKVTEQVRDKSALIIWSGCLEGENIVVDDPVWSMDILPTLSNLFGLEYDSRLMIGRDVFSDSSPLVFWPVSYSWKTDLGYYNAGAGTFTPVEGAEIPEGYVETISTIIRNKITYSRSVQRYNYFNVVSALINLSGETEE